MTALRTGSAIYVDCLRTDNAGLHAQKEGFGAVIFEQRAGRTGYAHSVKLESRYVRYAARQSKCELRESLQRLIAER